MQSICRVAIGCCTALLIVGCAKKEQPAADTTTAAAAPAPAPRTIALADVAGKWQVRAVPESGPDTSTTTYVLTATADTSGWFITFPSGLKVPVHIEVSGDSLLQTSGEFASQRRKGVKVKTEGSFKLQDGKLVGRSIAHYSKAGPDSVLHLRTEGTKMP